MNSAVMSVCCPAVGPGYLMIHIMRAVLRMVPISFSAQVRPASWPRVLKLSARLDLFLTTKCSMERLTERSLNRMGNPTP